MLATRWRSAAASAAAKGREGCLEERGPAETPVHPAWAHRVWHLYPTGRRRD